jgi:UPF0716 protein FxsA
VPLVLFLVFVVAPAIEIFVIVEVAHAIGLGTTLLALVAGAVLGSYVMRRAGASWWRALRGQVTAVDGTSVTGQRPDGPAAARAALLFMAGLLIFLPGFVSDAVGLLLLLPPVRGLLQSATAAWFVRRFTSVSGPGGVRIWSRGEPGPLPGDIARGDTIPAETIPGDSIRGDTIRGDVIRGEIVREDIPGDDEDPGQVGTPPR